MKKLLITLFLIFTAGFLLPEQHEMPVLNATERDWNPKSFWYYPWGRSITHKGIDIFAKEGVPVLASTGGLVIAIRSDPVGGNSVLVLGAKWRFHYYAHLQRIDTRKLSWVNAGEQLGAVGSTGNAKGKPPHLHYSIGTLYPVVWNWDSKAKLGWGKMFFVDPGKFLTGE